MVTIALLNNALLNTLGPEASKLLAADAPDDEIEQVMTELVRYVRFDPRRAVAQVIGTVQ